MLVRLSAPPVEGAANEALIALLARTLAIPRRSISIASGEKSRDKRIAIEGLSQADLDARVSAILNGER